ncbi:molybdopterin oxidoreductase family protein, partial [Thermodesulfobacteriota bacterium]
VSMCPTGALSSKNTHYVGTPERESLSICGFCGVGCSLTMGAAGERIIEVNPSHMQDTVNVATLCVRGHFAHDFLNAGDRLISPMIRKNGGQEEEQLIPVSWDEALESIANRLIEIKKIDGPQSIGFLGSSKCTNEENYLFQKMARVFFEANNVDNGGYLSGQTLLKNFEQMTDGGGRIRPLSGLEESEAIFVIGADPNRSVPVVSYYLKRAARKGIPLIVADPRRTDLVNFSSLWLRLTPRSDLEMINGIAALLNEEEAYDHSFIHRHTEDFSRYRSELSRVDLERICEVTGLETSSIEEAAGLLRGKKIAFVVGHGILQQKHGVNSIEALVNLSLFTGSLGSDGAGVYMVARENNQFGAWDMGAVPDTLPGRQSLKDDTLRKKWERVWKTTISPDPGLDIIRMIKEAEKGNLKALYIMGENPLRSLPNPDRVQKALERLDFLVVQDILNSETARIADVVLPGAAFSEKGGSFTNLEGRIQSFSPVVSPPASAKPDWEILDLLATKIGNSEPYNSLEKIRAEIRQHVPMYTELKETGQGWITETSQRNIFHADEKGSLIPFSPVVSIGNELPDAEFPFTAILGSSHYHLGSGTRTCHSDSILTFDLKGEIEISPEDSEKLDLKNGDMVGVLSPHGAITREVRIIKGLSPGLLFVPLAFSGNSAMNLIELTQIGKPDAPGWKTCQIKLEKV